MSRSGCTEDSDDTITLSRATLRFAVEVLDDAAAHLRLLPSLCNKLRRLDIDLRALLREQPAFKESLTAEQQAEPVSELQKRYLESEKAFQQQAEPVQEPFGYLWPTGSHPEFRFTQQKRDGADGMPLYTTPPKRKPLTDEQISKIWDDTPALKGDPFFLRFTRAIEAAHGIQEPT